MNRRKIGSIVCFIISLLLSEIGISLTRFLLSSRIFELIENEAIGGIAAVGSIFVLLFLPVAASLVLLGLVIAIIALRLGRDKKKEEKQEENVIKESDTRNNLLVKIEIMIYILWISLYILLRA